MMAPKFTPGPYRIEEDEAGEYVIIGRPTWPCRRFGVSGEWEVAKLDDMCGHPREVAANARLFAAADLLFAFVAMEAARDFATVPPADRVKVGQAQALVRAIVGGGA